MISTFIRSYLARTAYHGTMTIVCLAPAMIVYALACYAGGMQITEFMSFGTVAVFWLGIVFGALFGLS